jgi:hypothetical protein
MEDGQTTREQAYKRGLTNSGRNAYEGVLASWTVAMGDQPIVPAPPLTVRDFVRAQANEGVSGKPITPQTLKRMLAVISDLHVKVHEVDDPTKHMLVTSEMKALYRERGSRAKPIALLRLKGDVANIVMDEPLPGSIIHMLRELEGDRSGWALRARVMLGLGADTGRDRSDYVRLNIGDVVAMPDGSGHALLGANRTTGAIGEAPKFVSPDTMGFICEWLKWREKAVSGSATADAPMLVRIDQKGMPGRRLSVWGYVDILKDIMYRVGGGAHVSGNSFQAGLKLDLAAIGTTKVGIANALGFKEL